MTNQKRKELTGITGMLLAFTLSLLPISRISISKAAEIDVPAVAETAVSADYADENLLFDSSRVHTINLHISDKNWNYMTSVMRSENPDWMLLKSWIPDSYEENSGR